MNILKGFSSFVDLYDNKKDAIAPFGELTTQSKTFTRDLRTYGHNDYISTEFFSFYCVDEMQVRANPSQGFINQVLALNQWIYDQYKAKAIPPDRNKAVFVASIASQFPNLKELKVGTILEGGMADSRMPDYTQFKLMDSQTQYHVTIWYSDKAFRDQYDIYEVFVIPPLPNIADLTKNKTYVYNKLLERPQDYMLERAQTIKGNHPETALSWLDLQWHDPTDANAVLNTTWGAVIYGNAGYDNEVIKEAIRDYLDQNSNYEKWPDIYPSLYSENEFVIIPFWDNRATSKASVDIGMFSSGALLDYILQTTKRYLPGGYVPNTGTDTAIIKGTSVFQAVYRSILFSCMGNPNNLNSILHLKQVYPDYISVPTTDPDSSRMSVPTQEFAIKLTEALDIAMGYTGVDSVTGEFTRVIRRGLHFVAFEHMGYTYPVLTQYSFNQLRG